MLPGNLLANVTIVQEAKQEPRNFIYRLTAETMDQQGTLACRISAVADGRVMGSHTVHVPEWEQTGMMFSSYAAQVFGLSSSNTREKTVIPTRSTVEYIGSLVWKAFHSDARSLELWSHWKSEAARHPLAAICIFITGSLFPVSLPFECIRYAPEVGDFIRGQNIPILRVYGNQETTRIPDSRLPGDIIVFAGDEGEGHEALGIKSELHAWVRLLNPDQEWTDDDLNRILLRGETVAGYDPRTERTCRITVVPKGRVADLEAVLESQTEPFLFVYIGHGAYRHNACHEDGALVITPRDYSPDHSRGTLRHDELAGLLRRTPVIAVLLYCCETVRSFQVMAGGGEAAAMAESCYFDRIGGLQQLSAFRSKVSDLNASLLSQHLVMAVLGNRTLQDYNAVLSQDKLFKETGVEPDKTVRDHVSRVSVIRAG